MELLGGPYKDMKESLYTVRSKWPVVVVLIIGRAQRCMAVGISGGGVEVTWSLWQVTNIRTSVVRIYGVMMTTGSILRSGQRRATTVGFN